MSDAMYAYHAVVRVRQSTLWARWGRYRIKLWYSWHTDQVQSSSHFEPLLTLVSMIRSATMPVLQFWLSINYKLITLIYQVHILMNLSGKLYKQIYVYHTFSTWHETPLMIIYVYVSIVDGRCGRLHHWYMKCLGLVIPAGRRSWYKMYR